MVSASQIMSIAAFHQDRYFQSFPSFGSERMGVPVKAYVRFDDKEIKLRVPVIEPDVLIVQDETLIHASDVFSGLRSDGWVLISTRRSLVELGINLHVDVHIQAFRLAETVSIPVMVKPDGFILSHAYERVELPEQDSVDGCPPPFEPLQQLDPERPVSIGAMVGPAALRGRACRPSLWPTRFPLSLQPRSTPCTISSPGCRRR